MTKAGGSFHNNMPIKTLRNSQLVSKLLGYTILFLCEVIRDIRKYSIIKYIEIKHSTAVNLHKSYIIQLLKFVKFIPFSCSCVDIISACDFEYDFYRNQAS